LKPFPFVARVDRTYRVDGKLLLVELKTRALARVYDPDIIECPHKSLQWKRRPSPSATLALC